jgi:uncharacterized lipoprotein YmbA
MKTPLRPLRLLSLTVCGLLLAGCGNILPQPQADTVRYFTLGGPAGAVGGDGAVVRPVQLAGHLRNRAMAVRVAEHEIVYLDDVRWADSLDNAITQLLRARLAAAGRGGIVNVQVQRCELVRFEGNSVQLVATYAIEPAGSEKAAVKQGRFSATPRTWDGKDYGALVGLLRDAIGELGDALAGAVAAAQPK